MSTLFISDLHLASEYPQLTELFISWLENTNKAEALYILGDLFEAWIGDDDDNLLARKVAQALRRLSDNGVAVYFIHGNRDFLLGANYAKSASMTLLAETKIIDLYGTQTLLMHGDMLCTDDTDYQAFRNKVRDPAWQTQLLALPLVQRRALAQQLRQQSRQASRLKPDDITDVNAQAVTDVLRVHGVDQLIHGHTHRPGMHEFDLDGRPARRIVLGDWNTIGSILVCDAKGCRLKRVTTEGLL